MAVRVILGLSDLGNDRPYKHRKEKILLSIWYPFTRFFSSPYIRSFFFSSEVHHRSLGVSESEGGYGEYGRQSLLPFIRWPFIEPLCRSGVYRFFLKDSRGELTWNTPSFQHRLSNLSKSSYFQKGNPESLGLLRHLNVPDKRFSRVIYFLSDIRDCLRNYFITR